MSLETDGVWKAGVWATTVWGDCVWYEPGCAVTAVPPNEAQREPVFGGAGGWPTKQDYRNKRLRKQILQDDEDFMRIIQEALPAILNFLRR